MNKMESKGVVGPYLDSASGKYYCDVTCPAYSFFASIKGCQVALGVSTYTGFAECTASETSTQQCLSGNIELLKHESFFLSKSK